MKNSGIPWIGEIPEKWKVDTIGTLYSQRMEKVSDRDYQPLSVGKMGVVPQLENAAKTDNGDDRKLVRVGDFAINSRSDRRGSCGISQYDGSVSLINTILTPKTEMNPIYYNWLFHTTLFADEFYKWGHGIVDDLWTTRWQEMKRISIVIPPLSEQQAIADFLDKKCAEIDQMVALQEKFIEELKAYKQSLITETVTKGLNPNAPMKDSGVEWIGEIPEGWKMLRLKNRSSYINGYAFNSDAFTKDDGVKVIRIGDIGDFIDYEKCVKSIEDNKSLEMFRIKDNDILIAMSGATTGKSCLARKPEEAYINQRVGIIRCEFYSYISYVLKASYLSEYINLHNAGSAQPNISGYTIGNLPIPFPTLPEQQAIADYLDKKCAEIDQLIAVKQKKADELKEYKKSIIYEYVTGKRSVCE